MGWTSDQEKAIYTDTGNGNILVSANAGSGKTAVLVERVLQKILSGKSSVDRLLIVTFTEAAAAEMREKIVKRLYEYIDSDDCGESSRKLIKSQIQMLQTADIMTIDAFCNRVVQNNFHALGIDPDVRICDNGMAKILCEEALESLFSRIYKSGDTDDLERLHRLTDFYAKDRSNDRLGYMILAVYRFTESFAEPLKFLENACENYSLPVLEQPAVKFHKLYTSETAQFCLDEMSKLPDDVDDDTREFIGFMQDLCGSLATSDNWDEIYEIYKDVLGKKAKITALAGKLDALPPSDTTDKLRFLFRSVTDIFAPHKSDEKVTLGITKSSQDTISAYDPDLLREETEDIAWIVGEFTKEYTKLKEKQNVYEFSDIEHLTYRLFRNSPTICEIYKNKYDEILIDEYQDTNMLQDTIFSLISRNNMFMVGDLKQSIYRFRKGDPYIFREKSEEYEKASSPHTRINLSQNFRSRQEVLGCVNAVFEKVMSREAGDVSYRDGEYITRLNEYEYYPAADASCKAELHYLAVDRTSGVDRDLTEARFTAQQISRLLTSGVTVYDKNLKAMRPIRKKDIVILESSVKYNSDLLTDELKALGIDSYVDKGSFFDRREIDLMLSLLSVINNSHQDIPLIAVLRSPIGGFTDNELAKIRIHSPNVKYFISALTAYCNDGENERLRKHCRAFAFKLNRWRDYIRRKTVAQLIWTIYEETYFYDIMGAIDEGEEAQTNLRLLYERAEQYEGVGFKGLFNFIKYINRLKENDGGDLGGAKLIGENHDVVRIMTIHKSKGLEFPYVFLLGAGRDFSNRSDFSSLKLHKNLGIGLPHIYYDKHYAKSTYAAELIGKVNKMESVSERMRLLYVAMTRPKEKLITVVARYTTDSETETVSGWEKTLTGGKMLPKDALTVKGFYGWLCPTAYASPESWDVRYHAVGADLASAVTESETSETYADSRDLHDSVYKILDYTYPYPESRLIPSRTSVTQLKELSIEREKELTEPIYEPDSQRTTDIADKAELMFSPLHQKPAFMLETGVKPANEIGTLYHLVMSEINLDYIRTHGADGVDDEFVRLTADGIISDEDIAYVEVDKIKQFFTTPLGRRMLTSPDAKREQPFQINISAAEYDPSLSGKYDEETVILQGIIDCFFAENDGIVLFDYKTDKVRDKDEIRRKYAKQLDLYADAIHRLTGKVVTEKYLYLFDTGEVI